MLQSKVTAACSVSEQTVLHNPVDFTAAAIPFLRKINTAMYFADKIAKCSTIYDKIIRYCQINTRNQKNNFKIEFY